MKVPRKLLRTFPSLSITFQISFSKTKKNDIFCLYLYFLSSYFSSVQISAYFSYKRKIKVFLIGIFEIFLLYQKNIKIKYDLV